MTWKLHTSGDKKMRSAGNSGRRRRLKSRKELILICSIAVILVGIVGGTLAFLVDQTAPLENQFTYDKVSCSVNETLSGNTKSNISVRNTGTTAAYIRAKIIVTWQDGSGNVYGKAPVLNTDYTMSALGTGWSLGSDGYYYCTSPVASLAYTPQMFASITQTGNNPASGYTLCVEILADAVQSSPAQAVIDAWGVTVAPGGTISK